MLERAIPLVVELLEEVFHEDVSMLCHRSTCICIHLVLMMTMMESFAHTCVCVCVTQVLTIRQSVCVCFYPHQKIGTNRHRQQQHS